jgi:hypothetical protein
MYANGAPVNNDKMTLMVLVIRLNLSALTALSENAYGNIFMLADRQTSARIGNPIRQINTKLGRINIQPGESLIFLGV